MLHRSVWWVVAHSLQAVALCLRYRSSRNECGAFSLGQCASNSTLYIVVLALALSHSIPYPRPAASVELRCGVLYSGCQCVKRNGLQQDCPRSACQGRASCLDYPAPTCTPSGNSLRPYQSPCDLRQRHAETLQERWAAAGDQQLQRRNLDDRLRDMARQGYVDHPPSNARDKIPCRVHRRDELRTTLSTHEGRRS